MNTSFWRPQVWLFLWFLFLLYCLDIGFVGQYQVTWHVVTKVFFHKRVKIVGQFVVLIYHTIVDVSQSGCVSSLREYINQALRYFA